MDNKKQLLEEYVEKKEIMKEAEERIKELQFLIKDFAEVDQVYDLDNATVSMVKGRVSYQHTDGLVERLNSLKEEQKLEIQTGIATQIEGEPYLVVKFKK